MSQKFETPMMQQYKKIKAEYPDTLLFFRLGDFYELFLEDAEIGSRILDITLTARSKGKDGKIPMCGVPFHAIDAYLAKVVKAGHKAAICEQVSKPQKGVSIVEREVVRIITPGTITDEKILDKKTNNYVLTVHFESNEFSLAYVDISTGVFYVYVGQGSSMEVAHEIKRIYPSEVVLPQELYGNHELLKSLQEIGGINIYTHVDDVCPSIPKEQVTYLKDFFKVPSLTVFGLSTKDSSVLASSSFLVSYLLYTQKNNIHHITKIINTSTQKYMKLDSETLRNLEIFQSNQLTMYSRDDRNLFSIIDKTKTSLGGRKLKQWLMYPLMDVKEIDLRLDAVEHLLTDNPAKNAIQDSLEHIQDIERMLAKIGTKTANARDMNALKESLKHSIFVLDQVKNHKTLMKVSMLQSDKKLTSIKKSVSDVIDYIEQTIEDEPPATVREGKMIQHGVSQELDDIKDSIQDSKEWIAKLEPIERESTGINNLKVGYNSVFGYYIEVTKTNSSRVPEGYIRKQTLVNSERYITEDLKYKEQIVLTAEEKINELEFDIFQLAIDRVIEDAGSIQLVAEIIANVDCIVGFAELASQNNYVKPTIVESSDYKAEIMEGRHPVVESVLNAGEFTPNNTVLDKKEFIHLITGPNMAGKSTYIRQIALIQLLAQIGSYVPANKAEVSVVDGIYTRIGAGDALAQGLSTFMVEMIETAKILNTATKNSLIILDEVGRGTSTVDGLSIARAVTEYIHDTIRAKTLFATHFHELTGLDQRLKHLKNYHILALEDEGKIRFLHKVEEGGTDKSYGVEVAKLAGIPDEVVKRAKELLEKGTTDQFRLDI